MSGFDLNDEPPVLGQFEEDLSRSRSKQAKRSFDLNAGGDDEFVDCDDELGAEDGPDVEVFLHPIHGEEEDLKTGEFMYEFKEEVIVDVPGVDVGGEKPSQNPCSEEEEPQQSDHVPTREEGEPGREEPAADDCVPKDPSKGMEFRHFAEMEAFVNSSWFLFSSSSPLPCCCSSSSSSPPPPRIPHSSPSPKSPQTSRFTKSSSTYLSIKI